MLELVIPLTVIALLFVLWSLAAATSSAHEASDAEPTEPPYGDWDWPK